MKKALFAAALAVATAGAALAVPAMARPHHDDRGSMHRPNHWGGNHHRHCRTIWRHHHRVRVCR